MRCSRTNFLGVPGLEDYHPARDDHDGILRRVRSPAVAACAPVTSPGRRRELRAQYEQRQPRAGVYALRNVVTGRMLVASTTDLDAIRNRLEFAKATGTPSALDGRLVADVRAHGIDAFVLDILDTLTLAPGMTPDDVRADLVALEVLWREKLAADPQY